MNGQTQYALTFGCKRPEDKPLPKGVNITSVNAVATASQIQTISTASQNQQAYFDNGKKQHAVNAGDIAVLVRTGRRSSDQERAVWARYCKCICLTETGIHQLGCARYSTPSQAVLTPENDRALRASLASELFALDAASLDELNNDEVVGKRG